LLSEGPAGARRFACRASLAGRDRAEAFVVFRVDWVERVERLARFAGNLLWVVLLWVVLAMIRACERLASL